MRVKIANLGCTIASLSVPGKDGKLADVVLGFDSVEPYLKVAAPFFGCIVGAGREQDRGGEVHSRWR
ncbi:hypothetical protein EUGRSUZ_B00816 [Eucalyptus grandis]|uniref:Uncharacterized protein n=2 Tax=Eucalyptus grandis TaxID=71139 RepID=A0ACC3LNT4_EUCGR|nr:hypothetical protein EUGRSUZ_B00816 [Eucalyptus grandis]